MAANSAASILRLEPLDPNRVEAVKHANSSRDAKRLQIGIPRLAYAHPESESASLQWMRADGGLVAHWHVISPGAAALRVGLEALRAAPTMEIRLAGDGDAVVYGPFLAAELLSGDPTYWSPVLKGERALVELFLPDGTMPAEVDVAITQVSHLFVHPADPQVLALAKTGEAASCQYDVICYSASDGALANVARSAAKLTYTSAGTTYLCTGTLLNPIGPQVPYFYSSYTCIGTQAEASSITTFWLFDRTGCQSGVTGSGFSQLAGGATLLHASQASDASFMRLNATPPAGAWYAGWLSAAVSLGTPVLALHHPQGDWKKVSFGVASQFVQPNPYGPTGSFIQSSWTAGVTEYGSIGAGLFTSFGSPVTDYRLRGAMQNGPSSCAGPAADKYDYFSRLDQVYPSISQYLNPLGVNYTLSVSKTGAGSGTVASTPTAITCGAICSASIAAGTLVTLSAYPASGSSFAGWSGACTGTGSCQISIAAASSVTASFAVSGVPAISAGKSYECGLSETGALSCWGDNGSGKLGSAEPIHSPVPVSVGGLANSLAAIQAVSNHTCALTTDGEVLCWGGNYFGELGNDTYTSSSAPTLVRGLPAPAVAIAVGRSHNCALTIAGGVYCWGLNLSGQIGNGEVGYQGGVPAAVQGLASGVIAIDAGSDHTCALLAGGSMRCWGANSGGQLGNGTTSSSPVPVVVSGLSGITALSVGMSHTCAINGAGALYCWGLNSDGQLGNATTNNSATAIQIGAATPWRSVSAGDFYTCAVSQAGALFCWGTSYFDTLGTGVAANTRVASPSAVSALGSGVTMVSTGRTHACALRAPGNVYCWGTNTYGAIGDATTTSRPTPVQVLGLPAAMTAVAAGNFHSCAITSARRALCWGYNGDGQLGGGTAVGRSTPIPVSGLQAGVLEVKAGHYHTCAVNSARGGMCWGKGTAGQLGNDAETTTSTPVAVQGLTGIATMAVGGQHSCAVTAVGEVYCWGLNSSGQLGDGTTNRSPVPVKVPNLSGIVSVSAGWSHTCAVAYQGAVFCWGADTHGALGLGSLTSTPVPLQVSGLPSDIREVSGSLYHQCARSGGGTLWCWGNNASGQLGNGSYSNSSQPVQVRNLPGAIQRISAGSYHNCALSTSGGVSCWGYGGFGQLGDGFTADSTDPVVVSGLASGAIAASAGTEACAVTTTGAVLCWGQNNFGQLGDGTYVWRSRPRTVLARLGAGSLDTNDWYLDLVPSKAKAISPALTPSLLSISQLSLAGDGVDFDTRVKYKAAEFGKSVNHYVFGFVPPQFFSLVKTAPGARTEAQLRAKSGGALVFAILTPLGWTNLQGQLIAYSQGVANAAGGATNILNGVRIDLIQDARFCVGYGTNAADMLTADAFREVLVIDGSTASVSDQPCILSGVYLDGPRGSRAGTPVTFVASVVGLSPTGTIRFSDGPSALSGAIALAASANPAVLRASVTTSALAAGVHAIGAAYSGDSQNAAADAPILRHEVSLPTVNARAELEGPRDSLRGRTVFFWATVTGNNPTGSVQFRDGAANIGPLVPLLSGVATLEVTGMTTGAHSITATYAGDAGNTSAASNAIVHNVYDAVTTTVALASSANPAAFGAAVTFTATVTGTQPTGQVTFREGATVLARVGLSGGSAGATVTGLTQGQHLIEADYSGDGNNQAVTSDVLSQSVNAAFTPTSPNVFLSSSANPSTLGQSVTFSVVIAGSTTATGTVAFKAGNDTLCTATVSSSSTATCTTGALPAGVHLVTALYSGNSAYAQTLSSLLSQTVSSAPQVLVPSPGSLTFGTQGLNTTSSAQVVTLTNSSGNTISFVGTAFGGTALPAGIQAATPTTCAVTLSPGASCQMAFAFRPTFLGTLAGAIVITYSGGATVLAVTATGVSAPRLANISTRMQVLTGDDVMIGGFIIGGSTSKTVVVRARGPSLTALGVPGALANPKLDLYSGQTVIASNDNWQLAANAAAITSSGFAPANPLEAAILMTLNPGPYTAIVSGVSNTTGVGIVEVFEVDHPEVPLINIATRGKVLTGDNVLIGGFIIYGDSPQTVVVRARGPSLTAAGVPGALANPVLQLYSGQTVIAANDNWQTAANSATLQSSGFAPANTLEAAILITLNPGAYTAIVTGSGGGTGVAIIEVFAQ